MIYTVGHRENYMRAIAEHGRIFKLGRSDDYPGGYAVRTSEDARRLIAELGKQGKFDVFGLEADWETDTAPDCEGGWWHHLVRDAWIVVLP